MGHQQSYVRLKESANFNELVELTKRLGVDFFEDRLIEPVKIITLLKPIEGDLMQMCMPDEKYYFSAGEKFIYFVGERHSQRTIYNMYGENCPEELEIYFTECFPSDKIFNRSSRYAELQDWNWC